MAVYTLAQHTHTYVLLQYTYVRIIVVQYPHSTHVTILWNSACMLINIIEQLNTQTHTIKLQLLDGCWYSATAIELYSNHPLWSGLMPKENPFRALNTNPCWEAETTYDLCS